MNLKLGGIWRDGIWMHCSLISCIRIIYVFESFAHVWNGTSLDFCEIGLQSILDQLEVAGHIVLFEAINIDGSSSQLVGIGLRCLIITNGDMMSFIFRKAIAVYVSWINLIHLNGSST